MSVAGVAHPVERHLAKVEVASSSLVTRSIKKKQMLMHLLLFYFAAIGSKKSIRQSSGLSGAGKGPRRNLSVSSVVTRSIKKKDHTKVWSFFFMEFGG